MPRVDWTYLEALDQDWFKRTAGREFPWEPYRYLPVFIRDQDNWKVLERLYQGIKREFEITQAKLFRMLNLHNPQAIPAVLLDFLKTTVGFTPDLDYITDNLDEAGKRKVIQLACEMWKQKGLVEGVVNMIKTFTGHDAMFKDWFTYRWVLGVNGQLWNGDPSTPAPWLIGGTYGTYGEYLSAIRIYNKGVTATDKQVIRDLLKLTKPLGENYEVAYPDFLDQFNDLSMWEEIAGIYHVLDGELYIPSGTTLRGLINPGIPWFTTQVNTNVKVGMTTPIVEYMVNATDWMNAYVLQLDAATQMASLLRRVAGVDVVLGTAFIPGMLGDHFTGVQILAITTFGNARIRTFIDGFPIHDVTDATYTWGDIYIQVAGLGEIKSQLYEAFMLPLDIEYVEAT